MPTAAQSGAEDARRCRAPQLEEELLARPPALARDYTFEMRILEEMRETSAA